MASEPEELTYDTKTAPAGTSPLTPTPSGRGLNAAGPQPPRAPAAAPGAAFPAPGGISGNQERADDGGHPSLSSAPDPAPGSPPFPAAESGQCGPPSEAPARTPAAVRSGGRGTSRPAWREENAGPGITPPGPASSSPPAPRGRTERGSGPAARPPGAGPAQAPVPGMTGTGKAPARGGRPRAPLAGQEARDAWQAHRNGTVDAIPVPERQPNGILRYHTAQVREILRGLEAQRG